MCSFGNRRPRILVVDDTPEILRWAKTVLESEVYEVICAKDVEIANRLVLDSIQTNKRFDVALVDLMIGDEHRGDEFVHRLLNIVPDTKVIIMTSHFNPVAQLSVVPDGKIIKTMDWVQDPNELKSTLDDVFAVPSRHSNESMETQINRWNATGAIGPGILDLNFITKETSGIAGDRVEKVVTFRKEGSKWISTVCYPRQEDDGVVPISIQSTIGCPILCGMCVHWHTETNEKGMVVPYVGPLTVFELISQVYHAFNNCNQVRETFEPDSHKTISINFTGAGDLLVENLHNGAEAIKRLSRISHPKVSFIITSVGRADRLREYLDLYCDLPRVTHYWSVNSADPVIRGKLMPGTRGQPLEEMRDFYHEISMRTGRMATASFALFPGVNDSDQDVERIVELFQGWPDVRIKLMAGCHSSLQWSHGGGPIEVVRDITVEEVEAFKSKLVALGMKDVRFRTIYGTAAYAGCGTTHPKFIDVTPIGINRKR